MSLLYRYLSRFMMLVEENGLRIGVGLFFLMFVSSWGLMTLFEPTDSAILDQYWWYYVVTASTVGYGDMTPASSAGKVVAIFIIFGSITAFGVVTGHLLTLLSNFSYKIRNGEMQLNLENHIIILGYHPNYTEAIIQELQADETYDAVPIVLCFKPENSKENPLPLLNNVYSVKGDLGSQDVFDRACLSEAQRVVIYGQDDNETLAIALAVNHASPEAHLVAALQDLEGYNSKIALVSRTIECVPSGILTMIVQALQDPGISRLYNRLLSNVDGHAGFRLQLPSDFKEVPFGSVFCFLKQNYNATAIAVTTTHHGDSDITENPDWNTTISQGMGIFYIAPKRLKSIDWNQL